MSQSKVQKIEALLHSPVSGEREAARAALDRLTDEKPAVGSPEWHTAVQEWCRKLLFCVSRLGSPVLSNAEIVLIRNWSKYRGDPWARGADDVIAIYRKLETADAKVHAVEALTDQVGHMKV